MKDDESRRIVERLWSAMDARAWDEVASLLADDFVCDWPVSGERTRGHDNFVAIDRADPADWSIAGRRVVTEGNRVASEVMVTLDGRSDVAVSFYNLRDDQIVRAVDDWPEPYAAPPWRAKWVEQLEGPPGSPPA